MSFVHLHNHTHYSILSALGTPEAYAKKAKELGMPALAITDNGVMYGAIELYKACKKYDIKPIVGMEAYIAPQGRQLKSPENRYFSLVLLAKNKKGYQNLMTLSTLGHLEGFYYKGRIDHELLEKHAEGLIALSSHLGGGIPKAILENNMVEAKRLALYYKNLFQAEDGPGFYLEIQDHPEVSNWSVVNQALYDISQELDIPLVLTNDVHYLSPEDAEAHDVLLCVQNQKTTKDTQRFRYVGDYSLKKPEAMQEAFPHWPEAVANTLAIAERCELSLTFNENQLPFFDTGAVDADTHLAKLCQEGLVHRYGEGHAEAQERLDYELAMIRQMGFASYFLIVHDFIDYAKKQGILVGPGRGSAAGAIIAYCLGITELDPLEYGLLFERFLNPERVSMPDIDIDFADTRRDEVLAYVIQKYGEDRVAQIITFGTLAPKAAIRDAGRALGYSYGEVDIIAKSVPDAILGKYAPLAESVKEDRELAQMYSSNTDTKAILDTAIKLEGTVRQVGTHACAVIISRDKLVEHTPLQRAAGEAEGIVTQYSMKPCEELGLLKMDFLGLKNLSIMETCLGILKRTKPDLELNLNALALNDEKTFKLLQEGRTTGVFQLESGGMKRYLKDLKPTEFGDIIAMVSLYRPGPMQFISTYIDGKHGTKKVEYLHPSLEKILKNTYGIAIYQEQILEIAKQFSGFSLGEADLLRRAIGKKIPAELAAQREKFIEGAMAQGQEKALAVKIFDDVVEPFAGYGFNKSHAACYALISYQTAYLKANHPAEYMAALLTADAENTDRVVIEIQECREMGIAVLPPDIHESLAHFTVINEKTIRFGLTAIKGIGENAVREIIHVRETQGSFSSLEDFAEKVPVKLLNKKTLEALALSGSLDRFAPREQIAVSYEAIASYAKDIQKNKEDGQMDIFGGETAMEKTPLKLSPYDAVNALQRLKWEKEVLGLYVSGHPLDGLDHYMQSKGSLIKDLEVSEGKEAKSVKITALVSHLRRTMTKTGGYMLFGELEDSTGTVPFVVFPRTYDQVVDQLVPDAILRFEGKLDDRRGEKNFVVYGVQGVSYDQIQKLAKAKEKLPAEAESYDIFLQPNISLEAMQNLRRILEDHTGEQKVTLILQEGDLRKKIHVPFGVSVNESLKEKIKAFTIEQSTT